MRAASSFVLILVVALAAGRPVAAQSPLEGPLAASGAQPATSKPKPKPTRKKPAKTAHKADPQPAYGAYDPAAKPQSHPVAETGRALADDPLSVGMKWNGSNDSARETRIQNYGGDAQGTGAEVGMKLHF